MSVLLSIESSHQSRVVGNLLAIICGDAKVQPTYEIQDYDAQKTTDQLAKALDHLAGIEKLLKAQQGK